MINYKNLKINYIYIKKGTKKEKFWQNILKSQSKLKLISIKTMMKIQKKLKKKMKFCTDNLGKTKNKLYKV